MRNLMTAAAIVALCALATLSAAQIQPATGCTPSEIGVGVCPPTGNSMGQSNYQRATLAEKQESASTAVEPVPVPAPNEPVGEQPLEPSPYVEPSGAGAELYATTPMPDSIAVDGEFVYVLRGNEVVKLTKRDMKVVSVTTLPASRAPQ